MSFALWSFIALAIILSAGSGPGPSEQKNGLPLPAPLRRPVRRRLRSRARIVQIGGLIGLGISIAVILLSGITREHESLVVISTLLGMVCGGAVSVLTGQKALLPHGQRVERVQTTQKPDYVPEGQLWAARMGPPLSAAAVLLAWTVLNFAPFDIPAEGMWWNWMLAAWVAVPVLALTFLGVELTAAAMVHRPQHAGSELELAWDDCCRSESLRALYALPITLSGLVCLLAAIPVGLATTTPEVREGAMEETLFVGLGMFFVTLLLAAIFLLPLMKEFSRGTRQHVLRRLWGNTTFTEDGLAEDPAAGPDPAGGGTAGGAPAGLGEPGGLGGPDIRAVETEPRHRRDPA